KEWDDKKLVLEAFDYYFLGRPFLDEIEIWRVPDETVRGITYQAEVKKRNLSTAESEPIQKKNVENGFRFLAFNFNRHTIVRKRLFREALFHLIDMKKMWKDLRREDLVEASSFFPWKSKPPVKDPSRVQPLLAASGYQGEPITLYFLNHPKAREEAEWIRSEAKLAGIHMRLIPFTMDQLYAPDLEREADLVTLGEVASTDLHLSFLTAFYNKALLFRRLFAPEHLIRIEKWLDEMKRETDPERRELWIDKVEEYLRKNHLILFLHHPMKSWTFHPLFQDICFESFGLVDFRRLWIE
ncbi:MAG: ABC transporter substrate-binding protein, partial [Thermicanus sp.]|nr:ABC transporter substrate-binding protein [Thermicanus sp.]